MSIADLLVPNPYPLNVGAIGTPSITTNTLYVNATVIYPPVVISSVTPNSNLSVDFENGGTVNGQVGVNATEASPSTFLWASGDIKLGTSETERIRIKAAGIATNNAATQALALAPADTTLYALPLSSSGTFTSTWTSLVGFSPAPPVVNIQYIQLGAVVMCQLTAYNTGMIVGINTANITLPIARAVAFTGVNEECSGGLFANGAASHEGIIVPAAGTMASALVSVDNVGVADNGALRGSFSYRLSP
jgi:hypothetical protein